MNGSLSEQRSSSTQGGVPAPLLYSLYTNPATSEICLLYNVESEHGPVLDMFVKWCDEAFQILNATETKDMFMDYRKSSLPPTQTFIKGAGIEFVEHYKYLGTAIDKYLKFDANSDVVCKK